ncbi:MAG: quinone-dependent dihydroorotate dehydrogenase [Anaerolineales bacterium]
MYSRLRPLLFSLDPERTHSATLWLLQLAGAFPPIAALLRRFFAYSALPVELFGLRFPNVVGLAAGYDKDGLAWRGLATLGFGHIEIGSVTPKPQPGNPKPRLFRLPEDQALINRMGFPSRGADFVLNRLRGSRPIRRLIVGVNLGINRSTPPDNAAEDYLLLMDKFNPVADYVVINLSSPNTPGLRTLQTGKHVDDLLRELTRHKTKPLLVKLSPDLDEKELEEVAGRLLEHRIEGVIATNTTTSRPQLRSPFREEIGGLSGTPLTALSRNTVSRLYAHTGGKLPIIAVGGIISAEDAKASLDAGASLVQIFTGLVYRGPGLIRDILRAIS